MCCVYWIRHASRASHIETVMPISTGNKRYGVLETFEDFAPTLGLTTRWPLVSPRLLDLVALPRCCYGESDHRLNQPREPRSVPPWNVMAAPLRPSPTT